LISLDSPVEAVLGDLKPRKRTAIVDGLGLRTVGDLLHHFPRRYLETGRLTKLDRLQQGQLLIFVGEIVDSEIKTHQDRRTGRTAYRLEAVVAAQGHRLKLTFFAKNAHMAQYHADQHPVGGRGLFIGKASQFRNEWQLAHPEVLLFEGSGGAQQTLAGIGPWFPVYPLTKGLLTWDLQRAATFALSQLDDVPDPLPEAVLDEYDLPERRTALEWIHGPDDLAQADLARRRFQFEEALLLQLVLLRRRRALLGLGARARTGRADGLLAAFDQRLPFELTEGQLEVGEEIERDLAQPHPMHRLLQGEVGSGKTLVALRAMLRVVDSGGQAALLAPTEVLAQQHHRSITAMLGDLAAGGMLGGADDATTVTLLTGSMTRAQRQQALLDAVTGDAGIVIGTHALLQDEVEFHDLGLVVVDEQHRFGVEQRAALTDKAGGTPPHVLVMTATPIPRTVAMTVFGDLEVSTLKGLPAGRAPIQTNVVPLAEQPHWLDRAWQRVREEVEKGHQAYVVAPRITGTEPEQGETDQVDLDDEGNARPVPPPTSVEELAPELASGPLRGLRVAALHGRMPPEEKDRTMRAFAAGDIQVLVSTTVIEVGVDVGNATTMVIMDADRFGVSQLHQLRGRVGRGGHHGLCLLVTGAEADSPARERLDAVASTTDGFTLSMVDLEQRREGDVLGARQSGGRSSLHTLRVLRDEETIVQAREAASRLLDAQPTLEDMPLLGSLVQEIERSAASDYLDKG
jgi:ATP-dependent DNA helicase RecG